MCYVFHFRNQSQYYVVRIFIAVLGYIRPKNTTNCVRVFFYYENYIYLYFKLSVIQFTMYYEK